MVRRQKRTFDQQEFDNADHEAILLAGIRRCCIEINAAEFSSACRRAAQKNKSLCAGENSKFTHSKATLRINSTESATEESDTEVRHSHRSDSSPRVNKLKNKKRISRRMRRAYISSEDGISSGSATSYRAVRSHKKSLKKNDVIERHSKKKHRHIIIESSSDDDLMAIQNEGKDHNRVRRLIPQSNLQASTLEAGQTEKELKRLEDRRLAQIELDQGINDVMTKDDPALAKCKAMAGITQEILDQMAAVKASMNLLFQKLPRDFIGEDISNFDDYFNVIYDAYKNNNADNLCNIIMNGLKATIKMIEDSNEFNHLDVFLELVKARFQQSF